ncbi:MAG: hypothetical protein ACKO8I_00140 [Cyanobacteriota bacterium]
MSFPTNDIDPLPIEGLPKPPPRANVSRGTVLIVKSEPGRGQTVQNAITLKRDAKGVIGANNQVVNMRGNSLLTTGTKNGNPVPMAGLFVNARRANKVVIDLNSFRSRSAQVKRLLIPKGLRSKLDERPNTFVLLSRGNDSFIGSKGADLVVLNRGNNAVRLGRGPDTVVVNKPLDRSIVALGRSHNTVIFGKQGLRRAGLLTLANYVSRSTTIQLPAAGRTNVRGFGTNTLRFTTRNDKTFLLRSNGDAFSRSSVEFI